MRLRIALFTLGMAAYGYAQTLTADIPFQFHVGDQSYAPGRYSLSSGLSSNSPNCVWAMRSSETRKTILFPTIGGGGPALAPASRLIFHKYGKTYFLSEVWVEGSSVREIPASKGELSLRGEGKLAKNTLGGEAVAVNSLR